LSLAHAAGVLPAAALSLGRSLDLIRYTLENLGLQDQLPAVAARTPRR
jgi:hypothetical protein